MILPRPPLEKGGRKIMFIEGRGILMDVRSRIYVAGHRGLVGSALLRKLRERGYEKILFKTRKELDLRRQAETEAFFERERPEYVFLAAAKVGGILANATYKAEFIYDNIAIAANIIHASHKTGVKKLLNLGSSCIYPKFSPQPMKEDYLLSGTLESTNEPYAIAKIAAIKLCRYYNEQYGTNFLSVMPTNLYGPCDNFNLETAHVLPALIRKFHLAKLLRQGQFELIRELDLKAYPLGFEFGPAGGTETDASITSTLSRLGIRAETVVLWGSGEPYREFLYVDDLAEACLFLMERYDAREVGEFVNIGLGEDIRVKDLAELIREVVGFDGAIQFDPMKPDGTSRKLLDVSRIRALGWKPGTTLEKGVRLAYESYLQAMRPCE
jgi:GDP-L-fucose synthase